MNKLRSKDFLSNLPMKIIICCVTDQQSITRSGKSVMNFKFSLLTFLRLMSCSVSIEQKLSKEKPMFCMQACHSRIAQVEYQGQTRYTRILDRRSFIDVCYRTGHRLDLKYFNVAKYDESNTSFSFFSLDQYELMSESLSLSA